MNEWKEIRLGDFIEFNPRVSLDRGVVARKIAMENLEPHTRDIHSWVYEAYSGGSKFQNGDTVMARITPCLENGKHAYVSLLEDNETAFGSTEFIVMRGRKGVSDSKFVYYLTRFSYFRRNAIKSMVGSSGRQRAQVNVLENLWMDLPPLSEQIKIAQFLGELDDKIECNRQISANLEAQAQAIFKHWFIDFVPFKEGKFIESELGKIPEGWKVGTLGDILTTIETGNRPTGGAASKGIPSIGAEKIEGICHYDFSSEKYVPREFFENMRRGKVQSRDVLLYKDGAYTGKSTLFMNDFPYAECAVNEHVFLLRTDESKWQCWLYLYLSYEPIRRYIHTLASAKAAQPGLNQVELKSVKIILPPADVIDRFEATAHSLLSPIIHYLKENRDLSMLRDTLLPKLMSGQIKL